MFEKDERSFLEAPVTTAPIARGRVLSPLAVVVAEDEDEEDDGDSDSDSEYSQLSVIMEENDEDVDIDNADSADDENAWVTDDEDDDDECITDAEDEPVAKASFDAAWNASEFDFDFTPDSYGFIYYAYEPKLDDDTTIQVPSVQLHLSDDEDEEFFSPPRMVEEDLLEVPPLDAFGKIPIDWVVVRYPMFEEFYTEEDWEEYEQREEQDMQVEYDEDEQADEERYEEGEQEESMFF
jgi:hypothetical protein